MTPKRYFHEAMNNPVKFNINQEELGPNMWFAFTRISGLYNISKLFTYTPPKNGEGISNNPINEQDPGQINKP